MIKKKKYCKVCQEEQLVASMKTVYGYVPKGRIDIQYTKSE
jgi:hypothetical protein